jgi:hypothetical protein
VPAVTLLAEASKSAVEHIGKQFQSVPLYTRSEAHSDVFIVERRSGGTGSAGGGGGSTGQLGGGAGVDEYGDGEPQRSFALFAVKRQFIGKERTWPHDSMLLDRAYRELRMLLQLSQLRSESRCAHFVQLIEHAKSKPPLLFPGHCEPDDVFMYYVLEYAATDLHSLRAKAPQYRALRRVVVLDGGGGDDDDDGVGADDSARASSQSTGGGGGGGGGGGAGGGGSVSADPIVNERLFRLRAALFESVASTRGFATLTFQLLWALACAQKQYSFVHNDLHMKNVLLCMPAASEFCQAYLDDSNQCWFTEGVLVKVTDFGLSRLTLTSNEVLYNTNNSFSELFDATRDLLELSQHLPSLRKAVLAGVAVSDDESRLWRAFLAAMKRAPNAKVLLSHEFFDVLKAPSPFMAMDNTLVQCFNGTKDVARFRRHLRCVIDNVPLEPDDTIGAADMAEVARLQATDVMAGVRSSEYADGGKTLRSQRRAELAPQYVLHTFSRKVAPPRKAAPTKRKYKKRKARPVAAAALETDEQALEAVGAAVDDDDDDDSIEVRSSKQQRVGDMLDVADTATSVFAQLASDGDVRDEPEQEAVATTAGAPPGPVLLYAEAAPEEERRLSKNKESFRAFRDLDAVLKAVGRRVKE